MAPSTAKRDFTAYGVPDFTLRPSAQRWLHLMIADFITRLLASEEFTDFTIETTGRPFKVHKAILCNQSEWFASACKGRFAESSSNTVALHDDKPESVEAMIKHMYGGSIVDKTETSTIEEALVCLRRHIDVYKIGDKYQLGSLKEAAAEQMMTLADRFMHKEGLISIIEELMEEVPHKTPWHCYVELGHRLAENVSKHAACLVHDEVFHEAYHDYPGLAPALVDSLMEELAKEEAKMGNITAVYCNNLHCRGHRRRWTYKHGPRANAARFCIWCGQNQLVDSPA